jgi:hypothetical protein
MIKSHKGIALIYVIAITCIVSLLIGVMMYQYILQRHSIRSTIQKIQSFYTAEAGIKKALYYIKEEKGINWRTGTVLANEPIKDTIFWQKDDEVEISVLDHCGYLKIKSQVKKKPLKSIEVIAAGILPEKLKYNLILKSTKPLILKQGSKLKGKIRVNLEPKFQGGSIEAILETNPSLQLPKVEPAPFKNSIAFFRHLLSSPEEFDAELFSPQVFSPENPILQKKVFVNDAVLIENRDLDSIWHAGDNLFIASTAEVQISGSAMLNNITIMAIGPIKILDKAQVKASRIYSETQIELREQSSFSGVLIAPDIKIAEKAVITNPSTIYCGPKKGHLIIDSKNIIYCNIINLCVGGKSKIEINENAEIEGIIYSRAPVTLKGKLNGFLSCNGFHEETGDTNTNVISGIINPPKYPELLSVPLIFPDINEFKIIKWQEY